ncbi:hypothetical protein Lupro_12715 [Lutibacter profundi]|uniref:Uncharacterized protein n=1 Tax=Lutibacter profundi TaxID=1622118 RepID=A0A109RP90_9FLAO|nr:hypothetical protein [Lutibacter profundi]AMC12069.1 hypothetical protein Lupro_12715 [Lutibacter profundi]
MKKQILGIFFYLLYLLAMVRPIAPIIEYYANYDYIASVLCENRDKPYLACNGKCYLEKQLNKVNHNNHDHKSTIPQIDFDKYPVSPIGQFSYQFSNINELNFERLFILKNTSQDYFSSILKPPQVIFFI